MTLELKAGNLQDFFASAKATAQEIDTGQKVTRKNIIWIDPGDLMAILKPERRKLIQYLREKPRVIYSELSRDLQRTPVSLNRDLKILERYELIRIFKQPNPGHGINKVIQALFGGEEIEFRARL
jgi:predicted transcriptional regulator